MKAARSFDGLLREARAEIASCRTSRPPDTTPAADREEKAHGILSMRRRPVVGPLVSSTRPCRGVPVRRPAPFASPASDLLRARPRSRKQTMNSSRTAPDGYSPLFSNATADQHSSAPRSTDAAATRKRSERNGDHHLTFLDLDDSAPADR